MKTVEIIPNTINNEAIYEIRFTLSEKEYKMLKWADNIQKNESAVVLGSWLMPQLDEKFKEFFGD